MKKIFLLFGASGELGKNSVKYFLEKDYDFYYFIMRGDDKTITTNKSFEIIKVFDLTDEKNVEEIFSKVNYEAGNTYFLFSTVGGFLGGTSVEETEYIDWQKMFNINLNTAFLLSKYFSKLVRGTGGGSICFTSAYSSFQPVPGKVAYNISKKALNYFVESFAMEAKEYNLSVNAVAPYAIDNASNREWIKDESQLITPVQICEAVESLFLNYKKVTGNIVRLP